MKSRIKFDLDDNNQEVIKAVVIKQSDDVRDRIAGGFKDKVGGSCFCAIKFFTYGDNPTQENVFEISPVDPTTQHGLDELKKRYGVELLFALRGAIDKWFEKEEK